MAGPSSQPEAEGAKPKEPGRDRAIAFGPFRLFARERRLQEGDRPVRLGSRALDILIALLAHPGKLITKRDLMRIVWPDTVVVDANLNVHIAALRRALGDGHAGARYIINIPGRGYRFVAPVTLVDARQSAEPLQAIAVRPHNLPAQLTRLVGRDETVNALAQQLATRRLLTIVGPGGVGKTSVALGVAERTIASFEHGVWLVDLAPLSDPRLVPSAVATVLGLGMRSEDPLPALVAGVRDKRMLLLLDTCEHVIEAAASLAVALLSGAPGVTILATSRESLRIADERVYHLRPLGNPPASFKSTVAETAAFPALQLFVERAAASAEDFALTDENAPLVVKICRRLDGLPLAIEFAAPLVAVLGIEHVASRLDESLPMLEARRRAPMPRHRTMRTVVDWSYALLSEEDQLFFRSLGIFAGGFTVEAAAAVAVDAAKLGIDALDRLADLVAKSLVVADVSGAKPRFRLLDTTRAYAIEKLDASGARERTAQSHAEYYRNLLNRAEDELAMRPPSEWLADYACEIDNLRAALDSTFSQGGDGSIGVALTAAAVPLWMHLSLLVECRSRVKQALGALGTGGTRDRREEMRLYAALGKTRSASTADAAEIAAFTNALALAESLDDTEYQLHALAGLFLFHTASSRHRAAQPFAQRFHDLAASRSDLSTRLFGEHIVGMAKHHLGDQTGARRHFEQVLAHYAPAYHGRDVIRPQDIIRFQIDGQVSARAHLARVLWLQGFPHQAVRTAEMSIAEAQATGHALSLCYTLALAASPIALWVGNLAAAAHYAGMLVDHSRKHGLLLWSAWGSRFQKAVVLMGGYIDTRSQPVDTSLDEILSFRSIPGLCQLAEVLVRAGRMAEGHAVYKGMEQLEPGCYAPELLRLKGELSLLQGTPATAETAKDLFGQALNEAHRQGALSWELRAATSLARLLRNHPADAIACLQPVYDRFTEGFDTADLIAARQLLDDPGNSGRR